jgi:hypothetical protein
MMARTDDRARDALSGKRFSQGGIQIPEEPT